MAYTITTYGRTEVYGVPNCVVAVGDPTTVETLFEACEEAAHRIEVITGGDPDYESVYTDAQSCSELGDTFGPLSDGTIVEVRKDN